MLSIKFSKHFWMHTSNQSSCLGTKLDVELRPQFHWKKTSCWHFFWHLKKTIGNNMLTHWWYLLLKPIFQGPFWGNVWERFIRHDNPVFHSLYLLSTYTTYQEPGPLYKITYLEPSQTSIPTPTTEAQNVNWEPPNLLGKELQFS